MDYLVHHGVKGMKWGVRHYQNPDGTLTEEGRKRYNAYRRHLRSNKHVNEIVKSMSESDRKLLMDEDYDKDYITKEETKKLAKRIIEKEGKVPVSFFDIYDGSDGWKYVTVGTRSGDSYRGKGYAKKCVANGMKWLDEHWDDFSQDVVYWSARSDNPASNKLAKEAGFKKESTNDGWNVYSYKRR